MSKLFLVHTRVLKGEQKRKKNDLTEVKQRAILKCLLFYHLQLSKPLYKLTITGRQADRQKGRRKKPLIGAQACTLPKNISLLLNKHIFKLDDFSNKSLRRLLVDIDKKVFLGGSPLRALGKQFRNLKI